MKTALGLAESVAAGCQDRDNAADACRVLARIAERERDWVYQRVALAAARRVEAMDPEDPKFKPRECRGR